MQLNNRKANHDYKILETLEAGIQLTGTEVKSLRAGKGNFTDSFARVENGEAWLYSFDIAPYAMGNRENHEPKRIRKLLLHKREILFLFKEASISGRTIVPLKGYFKKGKFKILLGIGIGKHKADKRQDLLKKDAERHLQRVMHRRR